MPLWVTDRVIAKGRGIGSDQLYSSQWLVQMTKVSPAGDGSISSWKVCRPAAAASMEMVTVPSPLSAISVMTLLSR